jgi:uncharacterized integral membrane protein
MIEAAYWRRALRRSFWATLAYLIAFAALLLLVLHLYMQPAVAAAHVATPAERQRLSAISILLLSILLTMLIAGLLMTFRVHRFFYRPRSK